MTIELHTHRTDVASCRPLIFICFPLGRRSCKHKHSDDVTITAQTIEFLRPPSKSPTIVKFLLINTTVKRSENLINTLVKKSDKTD